MQAGIHPNYTEIKVHCACGAEFVTRSTLKKDLLKIDLCSKCHPFFTGTQKIVDSTGRVERFNQKYGTLDLTKLTKKRR
jgi:large subunit ribosomal protein L31